MVVMFVLMVIFVLMVVVDEVSYVVMVVVVGNKFCCNLDDEVSPVVMVVFVAGNKCYHPLDEVILVAMMSLDKNTWFSTEEVILVVEMITALSHQVTTAVDLVVVHVLKFVFEAVLEMIVLADTCYLVCRYSSC